MAVSSQQIIEQQKSLQHRVATQQGRLAEHDERVKVARQDIEARFGTSDINTLRGYYKQLNEHRQKALSLRHELNGLVEQALNAIEKGEAAPADLIELVEVKKDELQSWIENAPSFGGPAPQDSAPDAREASELSKAGASEERKPAATPRPRPQHEKLKPESNEFNFSALGTGQSL